MIVTAVLGVIDKVLDRVVPDKNQREKVRAELEQQLVANEQALMLGQMEINKIEAQHESRFVAGWRPAVGWVCVAGLAYQYLLYPLLLWGIAIAAAHGFDVVPPDKLDMTDLIVMLGGMLGFGSMRSVEKIKDANKRR